MLLFLIFISCKSLDNSNSILEETLNNNTLKEIVTKVDCQVNNDLVVEVDSQSHILINPSLCNVFSDYISPPLVLVCHAIASASL